MKITLLYMQSTSFEPQVLKWRGLPNPKLHQNSEWRNHLQWEKPKNDLQTPIKHNSWVSFQDPLRYSPSSLSSTKRSFTSRSGAPNIKMVPGSHSRAKATERIDLQIRHDFLLVVQLKCWKDSNKNYITVKHRYTSVYIGIHILNMYCIFNLNLDSTIPSLKPYFYKDLSKHSRASSYL